jgi:hypothetical protein
MEESLQCRSPLRFALLVVGMVMSILVFTIAYVSAGCAITHSRAFGLGVLYMSPLYWLLMILIVGGEAWFGKYIISK